MLSADLSQFDRHKKAEEIIFKRDLWLAASGRQLLIVKKTRREIDKLELISRFVFFFIFVHFTFFFS